MLVNPFRAGIPLAFYEAAVDNLEVHWWAAKGGESEIPHVSCYVCETPC